MIVAFLRYNFIMFIICKTMCSFPTRSLDSIFLKRTATRAVLIPSVSLIFPAIT